MMSLPASQRRALGGIEGALRAADPHLASMFAIFARLNADEPVAAERWAHRRRLRWHRPRAAACAVLIPVLFLAMIVTSALAGGLRSPSDCVGNHPAGANAPVVHRSQCRLTAYDSAAKTAAVMNAVGTDEQACVTIALAARPASRAGSEAALSPPAGPKGARAWVCYK
jgi:hypothetical protein